MQSRKQIATSTTKATNNKDIRPIHKQTALEPTDSARSSRLSKDNANRHNKKPVDSNKQHGRKFLSTKKSQNFNELSSRGNTKEANKSSEMASTSLISEDKSGIGSNIVEQETNVDSNCKQAQDTDDDESETLLESCSSPIKETSLITSDLSASDGTKLKPLPSGWEQHSDKQGPYFWHVATGLIQRTRPTSDSLTRKDSLVLCHDDEEINQASVTQKTSSDEDDCFESGAALTVADDTQTDTSVTFVVYPLGCCEFDETQLVSASTTKAIQKCILRLANKPTKEESMCWGLDQSQPVLMRLVDNLIQFTDIRTQSLLRSQPIPTIKTWAVDDDNNFAFVVEDRPQSNAPIELDPYDSVDYALLNAPTFMCYVFRSMDDDDMSCRVAAKLNEEMNRYKEQMSNKISRSTRLQQMIEQPVTGDQTDADEDLEDIEESSEMTMSVKYIGQVQVPRPMGVDTLNFAIDKCLADTSKAHLNRLVATGSSNDANEVGYGGESPLIDAKLHVSPSSVIVENEITGEIIVECRIRYLTFIGISRRDIRWCGFIMQNTTNKSFVAHCFECYPTAAHVCEAIKSSCMKMYEKVVKSQQRQIDATSIIPKSSKIRDTLAKTLSRIKLSPII